MANSDTPHRTPVSDAMEDSLHRLLQTTHNLQRKIFRIARRDFLTQMSAGELQYDAASIARDAQDLADSVGLTRMEDRG
jgi:hypothetical protein